MISKLWQQSTVSCQLFPWHSPITPLAHANPVSCGVLFSVLLDLLDDSTLTRMGYNSRFCHMLHRARSKTNLLWNYEPNLRRCWSKTVTHHRLEQHGHNFESKCGEDSCASGASLSTPIAPSKLPVGNITIEPRWSIPAGCLAYVDNWQCQSNSCIKDKGAYHVQSPLLSHVYVATEMPIISALNHARS